MAIITEAERLHILSDLVALNTTNGNEIQVVNYLSALFKQHGIYTKVVPIAEGRANLVAEIGSGKPVFAVSGHMDVVSAGDLSHWDTDPFKMTEINGRLYGRGTDDMKSGLSALVIAMIELHHSGQPLPGTIRLLATIGEEVGELGSKTFYELGYMQDVSGLLIAEPSGYNIVHAQKGSVDLTIKASGISVHSSMPERGFNAINSLITVLYQANKLFNVDTQPTSPLLGPMSFNVDTIQGGNQVNSIPNEASVEINVRTIPEYTGEQVISDLTGLIDNFNHLHQTKDVPVPLQMSILMNEPPVQAPNQNRLIDTAKRIGMGYSHQNIPVGPTSGITDASNFLRDKAHDFPFVVFGPGETNQAHVVNEYIQKEMYLNFVEIYIQLFSQPLVD